MSDPGIVPSISWAAKLRDPKAFIVFHDCLWASAAHQRVDEEEPVDLLGLLNTARLLVLQDIVSGLLKFLRGAGGTWPMPKPRAPARSSAEFIRYPSSFSSRL